jgi:hypothetical protein
LATPDFALWAAGILIGVLVAKRFRVVIVLPIIVLAASVGFAVELARAEAIWAAGLNVMLMAFAIEVGYAIGIVVWHSSNDISKRSRAMAVGREKPESRFELGS